MPLRKGRPKEKFLQDNNLSTSSHPAYWLRAFLPNEPQKGSKVTFCTDDWATYTNTKALLANAGQPKKNILLSSLSQHGKLSSRLLCTCCKASVQHLKWN
eukprot:5587686-Ditylum_brightwellii.AAC.1